MDSSEKYFYGMAEQVPGKSDFIRSYVKTFHLTASNDT